jgi:sugar O-acyltransferase (sialic acid O-acetyltransferase NeuD family)
MKPLILIGGGGHCKSVIEAAESDGRTILGILDMPNEVGKKILGYPIIGTDNDIPQYVDEAEFVIMVGFITNPSVRIRIYEQVKRAGGVMAVVVASTANVSHHATIGAGTVVLHHASVNAGVCIAENCIINTAANIEHDCSIGAHTHISTGTMINGGCNIGARVFVGSQSVVANCKNIADDTVIGSGSNVTKHIEVSGFYWGSPAVYRKVNVNKYEIGGGKLDLLLSIYRLTA